MEYSIKVEVNNDKINQPPVVMIDGNPMAITKYVQSWGTMTEDPGYNIILINGYIAQEKYSVSYDGRTNEFVVTKIKESGDKNAK